MLHSLPSLFLPPSADATRQTAARHADRAIRNVPFFLFLPDLRYIFCAASQMVIEVDNETPHRMDAFGAGGCAFVLIFLAGTGRASFRASSFLSGKDHYSSPRQHTGRNRGNAGQGADPVSKEA